MLPAEMADGTRARMLQREEEHAEDGDAEVDPEVVLADGEDGDNPQSQSSLNVEMMNPEMNMHSE